LLLELHPLNIALQLKGHFPGPEIEIVYLPQLVHDLLRVLLLQGTGFLGSSIHNANR
jgi:hypothetical protein